MSCSIRECPDSQKSSNNRFGVVEGGAGAFDLGEDLGAFGIPSAGLGIVVASGEIGFDVAHQLAD